MPEEKQTSATWSVPYPLAIAVWVAAATALRIHLGPDGALLAVFGALGVMLLVVVTVAVPRLALILAVAAVLVGLLVKLL